VGISVWAVEFSSDESYAGVLRNYQLCYLLGGLFLSSLPGYFYDAFGTYSGAFLLLAGALALFTLLLWGMYRYARRQLSRAA
jgi:nitrate/nitrite transporter NarK